MHRKLFLIIWISALFGAVAIIPFALTAQADQLQSTPLPFSLPILLLISILQSALLLGIVTAIGLWLAPRVGLGLPLIEGWLGQKPPDNGWRSGMLQAIFIGIVAALIIVGLETFYFVPAMAEVGLAFPESAQPPAWQGFLASFYGGITEEVLLRLFLMTLLVWLGSKATRASTGQPTSTILWLAIILSAIIFGLGHLPATAAFGLPLNSLIVTRAIILNGIPGLAFGWLYGWRGLESAMVAHFSADILLHVLIPLFLGAT